SVTDELYNQYSNDNTFKNRVYGESQTPNMENNPTPTNEEFAISVYGDSYSIPESVQTPSFPAYLSKYTDLGLVYNLATDNESIEMMAAREGGVPMYISPCDISSNKKSIEITLENEYGTNLVPNLVKNAGFNPCTVKGVTGVISTKNDKLYFTRDESGYETIVSTPTTVETRAMKLRLNDVSVFFIGSDSLYSNKDRIKDIYTKMVNNLKTDKYLIIGPIMGTNDEVKNGNEALSEAFGNKFLNLHDYLINEAIDEYGIELNDTDKEKIEKSNSLPSYYFSSKGSNYFNAEANNIIGKKVADKLRELNYL
ncbi:MAG: hypothetical protein ACI4VF_05960, partial [Lachnospirales bacterium]